ncbi:heavy-metal-associated domain-containing protein [Paludibacteraceae bacterium OttesenSCG-928-F17]|nr:heavy-metal-associated domain-containing protein [Paludibacteraceae bacterium OttesenSCG-928-F17]
MITKTLRIEGMSCPHCVNRVEKALNAVEGITAKVDLATNTAHVELSRNIDDSELKNIVESAGYKVVEII